MATTPHALAAALALLPSEGEALTVVGEHVRILVDGKASGGSLLVFLETTPPGMGPPVHRHLHDDEFFFVVEGRFRFVVDGRTFIAEPGAFATAPRGSLHAFCNTGSTPGKLLITCTPAGLEDCFRKAASLGAAPTPEALAACFEGWVRFEGPPIGTH